VHVVVAVALRQAFFSIRRLGRGHCGGAMVAGNAPGQVETVIAWSGGRRLHLLTWGEINTVELIYAGRAAGWLVVPSLEPG